MGGKVEGSESEEASVTEEEEAKNVSDNHGDGIKGGDCIEREVRYALKKNDNGDYD